MPIEHVGFVAIGGQDPNGDFAVAQLDSTGAMSVGALSAGQNLIGYVNPGTAQQAAEGTFFLASTGVQTLSVAGNLTMLFTNPATSTKTVSLVRLTGESTAQGWGSLYLNPNAGLPTAMMLANNALLGGGNAAVSEVYAGTSTTTALSGGVATGIVIGVPANVRVSIDLPPLILLPGNSVGINVPFTGAATASVAVYWTEN